LKTITAMSFVHCFKVQQCYWSVSCNDFSQFWIKCVAKQVRVVNKRGNMVSILLCPSMATVMGPLWYRKLAYAGSLRSDFNLQFNKCSNSWQIQVPSLGTW
jgi:hypothetical protein